MPKTTEHNRIVRTGKFEVKVTNNKKNCTQAIEAIKLTTDRYEASHGLFATAELHVIQCRYAQTKRLLISGNNHSNKRIYSQGENVKLLRFFEKQIKPNINTD